MGCDPIWGNGNKVQGFVCSRSERKKKHPACSVCGEGDGANLCDGPGERTGRTCDKPLCDGCAVSLKAHDLDFCPEHARGRHPEVGACRVGNATRVRCEGVIVEKVGGVCLHHAVLFDEWVGHHGGNKVYATHSFEEKERARRRGVFRDWLKTTPPEDIDSILEARHLR